MGENEASSAFLERIQNLSPKRLALLAVELERRLALRERAAAEPIAVVGMACRMPGDAETPEEFWKVLVSGRDAIEPVPPERWAASAYVDPRLDTPGKTVTANAGYVRNIDRFDPAFFGIAPREAAGMDPQQRLLLEVTWEALERAGERADRLEETNTGVFIGFSSTDYEQLVLQSHESALNAYSGSGMAGSIAGGRLSHVLGLHGPNLTVNTACSASGTAIHLACQSLRNGECERALAGGVNLILMPASFVILSQAHMLASDGRCKTFSRDADGFGRAEGCGMLVLKRWSDARAGGDRILGLIRGTAINHDGRASGLTAPNGPAQEAVIRAALAQAHLQPGDVDYIEAHGTGTVLGDAIELGALASVFGRERDRERPLLLGSVKTNVGHLEPAAAVAGVIKILLALKHEMLPPHLHLAPGKENEALEGQPFEVPAAPKPWPRTGRPRVAGLSSFGFSGTNCHMVIEEAPPEEGAPGEAAYPSEVIAVSAKTPAALAALCGRYAGYLREHPEVALGDFAYTTNACRTPFQHRVALTARTPAEAAAQLEALSTGDVQRSPLYRFVTGYQTPPMAFLFTGQGSQYAGMGRALYERNATFRAAIDRCDKVLAAKSHRLSSVIFGDGSAPKHLIDDTAWTQPALFAVEYGLATMWASWGVRPSIVLGHSLGEYVAACVAGILTLEEALMLAAERGRLMSELPRNGSMLAIRASEEALLAAVGRLPEGVSIAAYNGPQSLVVSGRSEAVGEMAQKLAAKGIVAQPLTVSHAFHSPLMEPMLDRFEEIAEKLTYRASQIGFVSNLTGAVLGSEERADAAYWRRHVRGSVKFAQGLAALLGSKPALLVEVGPQPVLLGMAKAAYPDLKTPGIPTMRRGRDDWQTAYEALQQLCLEGAPVDWDGVYRGRANRRLVLPTYPFQRQRYWAASVPRSAVAAPVAAAMAEGGSAFAPQLYRIAWPTQQPRQEADGGADAALVLGEGTQALTGALEAAGVAVRNIPAGEASTFFGASTAAGLGRNREALRQALGTGARGGGLVLLLPPRANAQDIPRATLENATAILSLLQEVVGGEGEPPRVWLVTQGAFACEAGDRVDVTASVADALQKVARLEHPELTIHQADLATDPAAEDWRALAGLVRHGTDEHTLAIRNGDARVARLVRCEQPPQGSLTLRSEGAYLVTGAFGGLGLRTAEWLAARGAKNLYLVGRHAPSEETQAALARMEAQGTRVRAVVVDVSRTKDVDELGALLEAEGAELRGIVHAAGTLDDGVMTEQTPERFAKVFGPKVTGAWLLHQMSLRRPLDFFAMFGSAAALLGLSGQANYAAANAFLEGLAMLRRAQGLPATTVAWGAWAEAGMATRVKITQRSIVIGIGNIAVADGMRLQEQAILSGAATVAALPFHWKVFFASRTAHHDWPLLRQLAGETDAESKETQTASLAALVDEAAPAMRLDTIRDYLKGRILSLLMLPADFPMREDQPFAELGLDSLMALELKNELQSSAGVSLPPTFLFEYPTLAQAALYLDALMGRVQGGELAGDEAGGYEEIEL